MMRALLGQQFRRNRRRRAHVIDLGHAEVRIVLGFAFFGRDPDPLAVERDHDPVAVEVIARGDRPVSSNPLFLIQLGAELEGLIRRASAPPAPGTLAPPSSLSNKVTKPRMRT